MFVRLITFIRDRWHPLWRLRRLAVFRELQNRWDCTVYKRVPGTGLKVAMKLLRDASWISNAPNIEPEVHAAFALILDRLNPAIFWDIGANIGFYSWLVRKHPSVAQIVMFEPDPINFSLIERTIRKNAISDCRAMNVAVAECAGEAAFLVDRASGATGSLETISTANNDQSLHYAYQMHETIPCCTVTVDGLIAGGEPPPDLIKIDVEGAEQLVLAGAESWLNSGHPTLVIETSNPALIRSLSEAGYAVFRIDGNNLLFVSTKSDFDLAPFRRAFSPCDQCALPL